MTIVECEHCHQRWSAPKKQAVLECPHCREMTGYRAVAKERIERAKWTFDGARTIQEMAFKLRARADLLRELANKGWELREPVHDDHAFLQRDLSEEEKKHHIIEVVEPTENDDYDSLTREETNDVSVDSWF